MTIDPIAPYFPALAVAVVVVLGNLLIARIVEQRMERGGWRSMFKFGFMALLSLFGAFLFVVLLPISPATKENILKVGGLVLTVVVAFSSTTVIRDAAAGVAMRTFAPFRRGDYLETEKFFGRVSEIGLVHTELQTQDRSLVTLANADLLNQSFKTIPASGTLVSTEVSLGYDVSRAEVENALIGAAESMELENPFVHVLELGNFSITYKVAGLLEDVENLLTVRSDFRKSVLDHLHEHNIEIVSPSFMNRRSVDDQQFIPPTVERPVSSDDGEEDTEEVIFEKALDAKKVEDLDKLLQELEEQKQSLEEQDEEPSTARIDEINRRIETIEQRRDQLEEQVQDGED